MNRRGAHARGGEGVASGGGGEVFVKLVTFSEHHKCMTSNEVNGNKSFL